MNKNTVTFVFYALGVFFSYFYYGILQEKITKAKYTYDTIDANGHKVTHTEKFTYSFSLVFIQCTTNYLVAYGVLLLWPKGEDKTKTIYYVGAGVSYLLAMVFSNMALQWVSYPTQVIGKSAKPIPVMILGVLLARKRYPVKKYFFVFLIVLGMVVFMFKDQVKVHKESSVGIGELLIILSLILDGVIGGVQDKIRAETAPTGYQLMKAMNGYAAVLLALAILITREVFQFIPFTRRYPFVIYNILIFSLVQAVGQQFIYMMVAKYGPLSVSIVTTTRKFFTVLASVMFFGNALTLRQWSGAGIVFTGLFLDILFSKGKPPPKKKEDEGENKLITSK